MNIIDIIDKKRQREILTNEEIRYVVEGYTNDEIPDYQMSALLMAIQINGITQKETKTLTLAMKSSGDIINLSNIPGIKVDKHSTGGVGDKTTLVVASIASACGVPVAKMSGRGLGFTGGTIDKLEAIPGFKTSMPEQEFFRQVSETGVAVIAQTGDIAPADKKIYALRDVTGTVSSMSLITASIMSKKLASGSDAILLDVKCGNGAFMQDEEKAKELGQLMVNIGNEDAKKTYAIITDMNQPLGRAVGNAAEVIEAIEVLKNNGPIDITKLSLEIAATMIILNGKTDDKEIADKLANDALTNGLALNKFRELIEAQGGDSSIIDDYSILPTPKYNIDIMSTKDGYINHIDTMGFGMASQRIGAGRIKKTDKLDLSAGIYLEAKLGDYIKKGDKLARIFANDKDKIELAKSEIEKLFDIGMDKKEVPKLIKYLIK